MEAKAFLEKFREDALEVVDNKDLDIDFRTHVYFQHIGRIEAVYMTNQITTKELNSLMTEWKQHWPFGPFLNRRKQ